MIKKNKPFKRLQLIVVAALLQLAPAASAGAAQQNQASASFKAAAVFLYQGRLRQAIGTYQRLAAKAASPQARARAELFTGDTYRLYLDRGDMALKHYDRLIRRYPLSAAAPDALLASAMVRFDQGHYQQAGKLFQQYLDQYPTGIRHRSARSWLRRCRLAPPPALRPIAPSPGLYLKARPIRVLLKTAPFVQIKADAPMIVRTSRSSRSDTITGTVRLAGTPAGIRMNDRLITTGQLQMAPTGNTIRVDGRRFRGSLTITANQQGLQIVNRVDLEAYLYGVVPKEMSPSWAASALQAQAVAARTYALHIQEKNRHLPFDVEASTLYQVYGGYDVESLAVNRAVDQTKDWVMTYDGRLIVAYFHADSGGHTEAASQVWGEPVPYLAGGPDRFSRQGPNGHWRYFLSFENAKTILNSYGLNVSRVRALEAVGRSPAGRVLKIKLLSDRGTSYLRSNNFRIKAGGEKLKSTWFDMHRRPGGILFTGRGYGHGVGMSQHGAQAMALAGYSHQQILKHYYKNVRLVRVRWLVPIRK